MARVTSFDFYASYRFDLEAADGATIAVERVWSDPFEPSCLWIVRAHGVKRETLAEWMGHCAPKEQVFEHYRCAIKLRSRRETLGSDRTLGVKFRSWKWLPLDLDAKSDEVAREHLKLEGVEYELAGVQEKKSPWFRDAPDHWRCNLSGGACFTAWQNGDDWVLEYWAADSEYVTSFGKADSFDQVQELCEARRKELGLEYVLKKEDE